MVIRPKRTCGILRFIWVGVVRVRNFWAGRSIPKSRVIIHEYGRFAALFRIHVCGIWRIDDHWRKHRKHRPTTRTAGARSHRAFSGEIERIRHCRDFAGGSLCTLGALRAVSGFTAIRIKLGKNRLDFSKSVRCYSHGTLGNDPDLLGSCGGCSLDDGSNSFRFGGSAFDCGFHDLTSATWSGRNLF